MWYGTVNLLKEDCDSLEQRMLYKISWKKYICYEKSINIVRLENLLKRTENLIYLFGTIIE